MGIVMGANGLGALVGPLLGGFLYEYAGYKSSFILCAGMSFLFSSFSFWRKGRKERVGAASAIPIASLFYSACRYVFLFYF